MREHFATPPPAVLDAWDPLAALDAPELDPAALLAGVRPGTLQRLIVPPPQLADAVRTWSNAPARSRQMSTCPYCSATPSSPEKPGPYPILHAVASKSFDSAWMLHVMGGDVLGAREQTCLCGDVQVAADPHAEVHASLHCLLLRLQPDLETGFKVSCHEYLTA